MTDTKAILAKYTGEREPSAEALEYAHDVRWPDSRIDLARLCAAFALPDIQALCEQLAEEQCYVSALMALRAQAEAERDAALSQLKAAEKVTEAARPLRTNYSPYSEPPAVARLREALADYDSLEKPPLPGEIADRRTGEGGDAGL